MSTIYNATSGMVPVTSSAPSDGAVVPSLLASMSPPAPSAAPISELGIKPQSDGMIRLSIAQLEQYTKIMQILYGGYHGLPANPVGMKTCSTGSGKTVVTTFEAAASGCGLFFAVCPSKLVKKWQAHGESLGLKYHVWSYEDIRRGNASKGASFSPLTIHHEKRDGAAASWSATPDLLQAIAEEGVFLILDETSDIKNESGRSKACQAVLTAIQRSHQTDPGNRSRAILLSATPTDKPEMAHVYLGHLGVLGLGNHKPYEAINLGGANWAYTHKGADAALQWVLDRRDILDALLGEDTLPYDVLGIDFPKDKTRVVDRAIYLLEKIITYCDHGYKPASVSEKACKYLLPRVVFPAISSGTAPNSKGLYYTMVTESLFDESTREEMERDLAELARVQSTEDGQIVKDWFAQTQEILTRINSRKIPVLANIIRSHATANPNHKYILSILSLNNIKLAHDTLVSLGFAPEEVTFIQGKDMTPEECERRIALFQERNTKVRIIIMSSVGSMGIDLDDRSDGGQFPRILFDLGSSRSTGMEQSAGRHDRLPTTSRPVAILVVYSLMEKFMPRHVEKVGFMGLLGREGSISLNKTPTAYALPDGRLAMRNELVTDLSYKPPMELFLPGAELEGYTYGPMCTYHEPLNKIYRTNNPKPEDQPGRLFTGHVLFRYTLSNEAGSTPSNCLVRVHTLYDYYRLGSMSPDELERVVGTYYAKLGSSYRITDIQVSPYNNPAKNDQYTFMWPGTRIRAQ